MMYIEEQGGGGWGGSGQVNFFILLCFYKVKHYTVDVDFSLEQTSIAMF